MGILDIIRERPKQPQDSDPHQERGHIYSGALLPLTNVDKDGKGQERNAFKLQIKAVAIGALIGLLPSTWTMIFQFRAQQHQLVMDRRIGSMNEIGADLEKLSNLLLAIEETDRRVTWALQELKPTDRHNTTEQLPSQKATVIEIAKLDEDLANRLETLLSASTVDLLKIRRLFGYPSKVNESPIWGSTVPHLAPFSSAHLETHAEEMRFLEGELKEEKKQLASLYDQVKDQMITVEVFMQMWSEDSMK